MRSLGIQTIVRGRRLRVCEAEGEACGWTDDLVR